MPCDIEACWIGVVFGEMLGEPLDGAAHLTDDSVESRRRSQRIFDDREIDPERQQALGEEAKFSFINSFICQ
jgi:hypothetical protein